MRLVFFRNVEGNLEPFDEECSESAKAADSDDDEHKCRCHDDLDDFTASIALVELHGQGKRHSTTETGPPEHGLIFNGDMQVRLLAVDAMVEHKGKSKHVCGAGDQEGNLF